MRASGGADLDPPHSRVSAIGSKSRRGKAEAREEEGSGCERGSDGAHGRGQQARNGQICAVRGLRARESLDG